jgi:hypothetical protein
LFSFLNGIEGKRKKKKEREIKDKKGRREEFRER